MMKQPILFFGILIFISVAWGADYLNEKPEWLPTCEIKKPEFTKCSTHSIQTLFKTLEHGIPGLDTLPTIDPLHINKIKINQGGSDAVNIKVELSRVTITGFKDALVKESRVSSKDYSWRTKFILPKMRLEGNYVMQGRILLIPLNGNGKIFLEAENMDAVMYTKTKLYEKGDWTFYNVTNTKIDYTVTGLKVRLDNLFNGNKELEDSTNAFFNANWEPVADALKPVIQQTVEEILLDILGKIFHFVPANFFVSDIPKSTELYGQS